MILKPHSLGKPQETLGFQLPVVFPLFLKKYFHITVRTWKLHCHTIQSKSPISIKRRIIHLSKRMHFD